MSPPPRILAQVEALLRDGKTAEAIRSAYLSAEDDVRRAYGMKLPAQWTHRQFLDRYLRPDMGLVASLLPRLHVLFEPVRYGPPGDPSGATLMDLLRAVYQEAPLRNLAPAIVVPVGRAARSAPGPSRPSPATAQTYARK